MRSPLLSRHHSAGARCTLLNHISGAGAIMWTTLRWSMSVRRLLQICSACPEANFGSIGKAFTTKPWCAPALHDPPAIWLPLQQFQLIVYLSSRLPEISLHDSVPALPSSLLNHGRCVPRLGDPAEPTWLTQQSRSCCCTRPALLRYRRRSQPLLET